MKRTPPAPSTSSDCIFTVDYPADADRLFVSAVFTNTAHGSIIGEKVTDPDMASNTCDAAGTVGNGGSNTVTDLAS